jgi:hypothetical protein
MKKQTFFIPFRNVGNKIQLISTKGMKHLNSHLPTQQQLIDHLDNERKMVELFKTYKPVPYQIKLSVENYDMVLEDIRGKKSNFEGAKYEGTIALVLQWPSMPMVIINPLVDSKPEENV